MRDWHRSLTNAMCLPKHIVVSIFLVYEYNKLIVSEKAGAETPSPPLERAVSTDNNAVTLWQMKIFHVYFNY